MRKLKWGILTFEKKKYSYVKVQAVAIWDYPNEAKMISLGKKVYNQNISTKRQSQENIAMDHEVSESTNWHWESEKLWRSMIVKSKSLRTPIIWVWRNK